MPRLGLALALISLALTGCEALLGVDDVVLEGAGGAGGSADAAAVIGVGTGLFTTTDAAGSDASSGDAASNGSGAGCQADLPPCAGATPNAFDDPPDLMDGWTVDRRKAEVKGQKLELDPDDDVAAIRSGSIDPSIACAVWITQVDTEPNNVAGLAVGSGLPGTEQLSIFRSGDTVSVSTAGQTGARLALPDPGARQVLRLRFDGAGSLAADVKSEGGCYEQVGSPVSHAGALSAIVFQLGDHGKSRFDDYCR